MLELIERMPIEDMKEVLGTEYSTMSFLASDRIRQCLPPRWGLLHAGYTGCTNCGKRFSIDRLGQGVSVKVPDHDWGMRNSTFDDNTYPMQGTRMKRGFHDPSLYCRHHPMEPRAPAPEGSKYFYERNGYRYHRAWKCKYCLAEKSRVSSSKTYYKHKKEREPLQPIPEEPPKKRKRRHFLEVAQEPPRQKKPLDPTTDRRFKKRKVIVKKRKGITKAERSAIANDFPKFPTSRTTGRG